ncbi:MAG: hypothetical protein HYR64_05825 [Fimbriimonas ginsengisoli]|uniref:Uncharacterized protein n=1 Tax=Fimbriimonas ginsengisoli TaxID=1005039 RepID=A0A931LUV4_FIMGI|nr:hypothetical protein [Fimbriimonas ginsengisoli]
MAKTITVKPEEHVARSYVDRLILEQLADMDAAVKLGDLADRLSKSGIGVATIRSLLASNPDRFAYSERRWVPAARLNGQGRPLIKAIEGLLDAFGAPMAISALVKELERVHKSSEEAGHEETVRRLLRTDNAFVVDTEDRASLTAWGFQATDERFDRGLGLNQVTLEEFEAAKTKLAGIDWRGEDAIAKALKASAPIRLKTLGAVAWSHLNPQDARAVLLFEPHVFQANALSVPGYVYVADGTLHPEADTSKWISTAVKFAERIAPTVDVEDAAPIELVAKDIAKLVALVVGSEQTATATKLLEDNYEITPSNKTFPDDMTNMMAALKSAPSIVWVGADRFRKAGSIPDYIQIVPEPFQFTAGEMRDEEGELIDVELTDEGLSSSLRKLLGHPLATDVLDEDLQPAPKTMPESLRLVLKAIHRELGTFPLCQVPTSWIELEPNIQELVFVDPTGRELQVWLNQENRLLYNLIDWWFEQAIESGAVFTITKTPKPNVFDFAWLDQPDPVVYISSQRMEELRNLGEEAEGRSTLDLLIDVMTHWPKGADYLTLLAEVNVIRRSSRRLIASLLSSYHSFYQRSGSPVWHFDPKKVEQGFDKTKRKFVRK